jgi:antitoxin YefM
MDTHTTISSTEARSNFAEIIDHIAEEGARYTVTLNGKPKAVLLAADELEGLLETLEILSEPGASARIKEVERRIEEGEWLGFEDAFGKS